MSHIWDIFFVKNFYKINLIHIFVKQTKNRNYEKFN